MPFPGFECQRCGDCCRSVAAAAPTLTEGELKDFEKRKVGVGLKKLRKDRRLERFDLGEFTTYEALDKQTVLDIAGVNIALEREGDHCAFFVLDDDDLPACGLQLDYGIKPATCRDFPQDPVHGIQFSNCGGCRLTLGNERADEIRRELEIVSPQGLAGATTLEE